MEKYEVTVGDDGTVRFYKPGTTDRHRLDGPAVEWTDGLKIWFIDGKPHRLDGPAIEYVDGTKHWYIDGIQITEEQFKEKTAPVKELTIGDIEKLLGHKVKVIS